MRARAVVLSLIVIGGGAESVGAKQRAKAEPKRHAAACVKLRPRALTVERLSGEMAVVLTWRAAKGSRGRRTYRVYRGGRVVRQTTRRSTPVKVRLGRLHKLTVAAVDRRGRPTRCRASISARIDYRPPTRPELLTVSDTSGSSATLTWAPATGGDSPLAGYRVMRDGAVYKQTGSRSIEIPLASNRAMRFTVAAVDRRGVLSSASAPVEVATGHTPPPTPADLRVTATTDSAVELRWSPSQPSRGRLSGYRVLRDGKPLFQVPAGQARATNLYAGRSYSFSVQAIDTLGTASDAAAPVRVTTKDPDPTQGRLHAFLLASTDQSFRDFQAHYRQIGSVYPTYYDCTPHAVLIGADDPLITSWAQARHVEVLPRFNCQRTNVLTKILTDPDMRQSWIDQIAAKVAASGADGASLDFEAGRAVDRAAYSSFLADLAARLHAQGQRLTVAVSAKIADVPNHPRSTFFDYRAISSVVDHVFVMAWGIKWATSGPGAQDNVVWVTKVADYVTTMPDVSKFVMGTQLYAMDWANGGGPAHPATSYEHAEAMELAAAVGASPQLDPVSGGMTFSYTDAGGAPHAVWFADARTVERRFEIAQARGLGIGVWRLGKEDQRIWRSALAP